MFNLPNHQTQTGNSARIASLRPRPHPGEHVEGWVVAEITPYPRRLRPVSYLNVSRGVESFAVAQVDALAEFFAAQYTPPAAQFVLAVVEYPSGPVIRWGHLRWQAVEIVLRSPQEWLALAGDAPPETPDLRCLVEELAHQALAEGWESAGRGSTWCSLRFRQHYAGLGGTLRWK